MEIVMLGTSQGRLHENHVQVVTMSFFLREHVLGIIITCIGTTVVECKPRCGSHYVQCRVW